jgi:hypothetical protein
MTNKADKQKLEQEHERLVKLMNDHFREAKRIKKELLPKLREALSKM